MLVHEDSSGLGAAGGEMGVYAYDGLVVGLAFVETEK